MLSGFWYIAAETRRVKSGRPTAATLLNQSIVLFRDRSRTVHALEDRCSHRGVPLSAGWQEGNAIRCRYHGWKFSSCGECLEVPAQVDGPVPRASAVRSYPVHEQDGWIWV